MNIKKTTSQTFSLAVIIALLLGVTGSAQACGGMITGTVTSPGGYPLPIGTKVKLFQPNGWDLVGQAQVDVDTGTFSMGPVSNGLYALKAVPPAGSDYTQSLPVPVSVLNAPVDVGTVALTQPEIYGTVTAPDSLTPVTAEVRVYTGSGMLVQFLNAPGGQFLVGGLPNGGYSLRASPTTDDPYWHSASQVVSIDGISETVTMTLTAADLYGVVEDHLGNPVQDAQVRATKVDGDHFRHHDLASGSGYYAIGGLIPGVYLLEAEPPWYEGGLPPSEPFTVTLSGAAPPYTLTLRSPPKVVTGTVETNTSIPVLNAQIVAHRLDKNGRVEALSDAGGDYEIRLSEGLWELTVKPISITVPAEWVYPRPPRLVHFQHTLTPETKQIDFTVLTADANVISTVEMPDGSAPPFTVTVSLHSDEGIGRRGVISPTGEFDVAVPNGGYKVWVTPEDVRYIGPVTDPIRVPPNDTYDLGTITLLERDAIITGTVSDEGGAPVSGVPVSAWRPGAPGGARAITGVDGQYALPVVAGQWHVQPSPGSDQPYIYTGSGERVVISSTQTITNVDFFLVTADATIEGVLVNEDGDPVTDAEGWANAVHTATPTLHNGAPIQAGAFTIYVPGGTYRVAAHLPAGSRYMSSAEREVAVAAVSTAAITLTVKTKDAHIDGALWDPRNQNVVEGIDAGVLAWAGSNWVATVVNPGNGTFKMDVAAGVWHLGYRVDPQSDYVGLMHHKNVPVASGQTAHVPLAVTERDSTITGTVLAPDGSPLAGAKVIADGIGPVVDDLWLTTHSGEDGTFTLQVPHGDYHLGATTGVAQAIKPAIRHVSVAASGISGGHVLQFRRPDAVISGTVTISNTPGVTGTVSIWAWSEDDAFVAARVPVTDSVGTYSLGVISNTTWHVGAVYETPSQYWAAHEEVVLGAGGATQDLELMGPHPKPAPVAVTFDASQPQCIELADGTQIYIPAGAMPIAGQVTLHVVPIATLPHQRHANVYRYGYAITAVDESGQPITEHFDHEVIISFTYEDRELRAAGIAEPFLKPAYFSTTENQWTFPESYVVDFAANRVVMHVDHFTDFALTGEASTQVFLPLVMN
jgi:hypothetical protein